MTVVACQLYTASDGGLLHARVTGRRFLPRRMQRGLALHTVSLRAVFEGAARKLTRN